MSALNFDTGSKDKLRRTSEYSIKGQIMASSSVLVALTLVVNSLPAIAAEPYGATVGGKPVTAVERPATKDLEVGFGLSRAELLEAARTSRLLQLAPSNFGPRDLGGSAAPGKLPNNGVH
jgi:hypothetical protein